jgi:hypothetical protein
MSALSHFLAPPKQPVVSKQISELSAFLSKPAPVSSDIAAFLSNTEKEINSKATPAPTYEPLDPDDFIAMLMGELKIGGAQSPAIIQKNPNNIHAQQLRQITSEFRAGRSSTSYQVLPVALRLSSL